MLKVLLPPSRMPLCICDVISAIFSMACLFVMFVQGCGNTMPDFPTWSHFIQDKLEISIYLSQDKLK